MSVDSNDASPDMDYRMHMESYRLFTNIAKYGTAAVVLILILMAIFLL
jgi:hypothetical protein